MGLMIANIGQNLNFFVPIADAVFRLKIDFK